MTSVTYNAKNLSGFASGKEIVVMTMFSIAFAISSSSQHRHNIMLYRRYSILHLVSSPTSICDSTLLPRRPSQLQHVEVVASGQERCVRQGNVVTAFFYSIALLLSWLVMAVA